MSSLIDLSSKKQNRVFETRFWHFKRNDEQRNNEESLNSNWTIEHRPEEEQEEWFDEEQRKNRFEEERWTEEERRTLELRLDDWTFRYAQRRTLDLKNARKKKENKMVKLEFHVDFFPCQMRPLTNRELETWVLFWNLSFRHSRC